MMFSLSFGFRAPLGAVVQRDDIGVVIGVWDLSAATRRLVRAVIDRDPGSSLLPVAANSGMRRRGIL
jgi:hypothetical protein